MTGSDGAGRRHLDHVSIAGLRRMAAEVLTDDAFAYFSTGARDELTQRANAAAWGSWDIVPRVLAGRPEPDPRTTLLGSSVANPVAVAPMSAQRLAHPDGELATARAAAAAGSLMVVSTSTTVSIEELVAETGVTTWFQLYALADRDATLRMARRAQSARA